MLRKNDVKSAMALELLPVKLVAGGGVYIKSLMMEKSKVPAAKLAKEREDETVRLAVVRAGNS